MLNESHPATKESAESLETQSCVHSSESPGSSESPILIEASPLEGLQQEAMNKEVDNTEVSHFATKIMTNSKIIRYSAKNLARYFPQDKWGNSFLYHKISS